MIRFCPNCQTQRSLDEMFCEGERDGQTCGWDLSNLPVRAEGSLATVTTASPPPPQQFHVRCANGHNLEPSDLICPECGADAEEPQADLPTSNPPSEIAVTPTVIGEWTLLSRIETGSQIHERYEAERVSDGQKAIVVLYAQGSEPDPEVYEVLRTLDRDHVPEVIETGRFADRVYEVSEDLQGGSFADIGLVADDLATLSQILTEVGGALAALGECGLRHRDLNPAAIMLRTREPLDLVITGFGSARLSDYDLDIVSPLEITRYTAPEAVAGGVAAASDWWSLGIIILEQVTRSSCFAGADEQSFLISILTNGAPIPDGLEPRVDLLLRGLLAPDRRLRWGWDQVQQWLAGGAPEAPGRRGPDEGYKAQRSITLGGRRFSGPAQFALAAADPANWEEAQNLLLRGDLVTWIEEANLNHSLRTEIREITALENVSPDVRQALTLKKLNPAMPLVVRGEIITPGWLIENPEEGYVLITGPVPDRLERNDDEIWLARLKRREARVRERARHLEVELDETKFRVLVLSTSKSRLISLWEAQRRVLPDTDHSGLLAIVQRKITEEEDLILLLAATASQFRSTDVIIDEAATAAKRAGLTSFDREVARAQLTAMPGTLLAEIDARILGFARCGNDRIDEWADQFRLERRLPVARTLVLLSVPLDDWKQPPRQAYVATLLDFFGRRITGAVMRGPLTRMVIGKTAARVDLTELDSERRAAGALLDHVLLRNDQPITIDTAPLTEDPRLERRLRTLHAHARLYRRDTGIDGLYLGFPFLIMQEARTTTRPRIAPVLLWPVRLEPEVGARGRISLSFDRDREEVRLNPAFETLLGLEQAARWREKANELLARASINAAEVTEAFREFAEVEQRSLCSLPSKDLRIRPGEDRVRCSAALFHLGFMGQAVMEDLRQLKALSPLGTSLETAFRVGEIVERKERAPTAEIDRYFTADIDPSQEAAVLEARTGRGLVIEGPPGTGKSQTIVNMVADGIGTGRSLLIVCQKQAALEVVHKRLDAAGLGNRIVMVNDVNKDREPVIRAVREQIEQLSRRPIGAQSLSLQRLHTAGRVEVRESALDNYHKALHAEDPSTGQSYRLILGELVRLAREGETPSLPSLRQLLGSENSGSLSALIETCAPLARLWLPAHYEGSVLAPTKQFAADSGTIDEFANDFLAFLKSERERSEVIERTPIAIAIEHPESYRRWAEEHSSPLLRLDESDRERLARWLDRLAGARDRSPGVTAIHLELIEVERSLLELPIDDAPQDAVALVQSLSDEKLTYWLQLSDKLTHPPSFMERLSLPRWIATRRRAKFMAQEGLDDAAAFDAALKFEEQLRPFRDRLKMLTTNLGEDASHFDGLRVPHLIEEVRRLLRSLTDAEAIVARIEAYPERDLAFTMARARTLSAVENLIAGIKQGLAQHSARVASLTLLERLRLWMDERWIEEIVSTIRGNESSLARLEAIIGSLPKLAAYQRFRPRVALLDPKALAVFSELSRIRERLESFPQVELESAVQRIMATEARLAWKNRLESEHPVLLLEADELESKAKSLAQADVEMRALNRRYLVEGFDASQLRPMREWEDITRLRGQRAKRLREFVDKGADLGLMHLRPVWLVNPDVASRLLPLRKALFDIVIFDEASQMQIEYALPTLYRSRNMIVSGDEKQMPPTAFFTSRVENEEAEVYEGEDAKKELEEEEREIQVEAWDRREIKDCPDLLQLAKTVLPPTTLQIHYRSAYRELIQFSNASFYSHKLSVPARHPADEIRRIRPIEVLRADGVYEDQTNRAEAELVATSLRRIWLEAKGPIPTVGVVTFNRKQADLIEEVLEDLAEKDLDFRHAIYRERDRVEAGEDMGFFVKNVENVQGDERDVIVFSSTFGRNAQGTFRRSFGVLGQVGGERRLNVAVTRARQKVLLVTSIPVSLISDFLSTRRQANSPRDYLQAYFEYARYISEGELDEARALLTRLTPERRPSALHDRLQDGLEEAVIEEIRALGWEPSSVREEGAFGLDFAIEDPRTGLYGIGIECDAPRDPLLANARAREIWRPSVLRRSIPVIHRVSSHRWQQEPAIERERLRNAIQNAMGVTL